MSNHLRKCHKVNILLWAVLITAVPALSSAKSIIPIATETALIQLTGSFLSVDIERARIIDQEFLGLASPPTAGSRLELRDSKGDTLYAVPLRSTSVIQSEAPQVRGDVVLEPDFSLAVKIPLLNEIEELSLFLSVSDGTSGGNVEIAIPFTRRVGSDLLAELLATGWLSASNHELRGIEINGPTWGRYDLVILGDGYQDFEKEKFFQDAARFTEHLLSHEPYGTYRSAFNVHAIFRPSKDSGADEPDAQPFGVFKDTAYDSTYNYQGTARCLWIRNRPAATRDAGLAPDLDGPVIVLVNHERYGGCATSEFSVSYTGSEGPDVQVHEFGHSFGILADEYSYFGAVYNGLEPDRVNVTADSTCTKWNIWQGIDGVGCFEGGLYHDKGIYRPSSDCRMRSLQADHCPVCTEALILQVHRNVPMLGQTGPRSTYLTSSGVSVRLPTDGQLTFSIENLTPSGRISWYVDGLLKQTGGTTFTYTFSRTFHSVSVEVETLDTRVRQGQARGLLSSTRTWLVVP